jgi:N-glycosylase/DNA lyase
MAETIEPIQPGKSTYSEEQIESYVSEMDMLTKKISYILEDHSAFASTSVLSMLIAAYSLENEISRDDFVRNMGAVYDAIKTDNESGVVDG